MERPAGVEPASPAWEAGVIPIYDGRIVRIVSGDRAYTLFLGSQGNTDIRWPLCLIDSGMNGHALQSPATCRG